MFAIRNNSNLRRYCEGQLGLAQSSTTEEYARPGGHDYQPNKLIPILMFAWLALQIAIPTRQWLYPGNTAWTSIGERFSWRMKLDQRHGVAEFYVLTADKQVNYVPPGKFINKRQTRKMACTADMLLQYAHFLKRKWRRDTGQDAAVFAIVRCSLNSRESAFFIDRYVDLSSLERSLSYPDWILPLDEKLPDPFIKSWWKR